MREYEASADIDAKARKVRVIVTDIDGVLTDGFLFIDEHGNEPLAKFNIYDGMGVVIAQECGLRVVILSGRHSLCTEIRFHKLGLTEVYTGIRDKKQKMQELAAMLAVDLSEIAFIGDDLIDLQAMSLVGLKIAPKNAIPLVKERVDLVTIRNGGEGVLREVVELILRAQDKYDAYIQKFIE